MLRILKGGKILTFTNKWREKRSVRPLISYFFLTAEPRYALLILLQGPIRKFA